MKGVVATIAFLCLVSVAQAAEQAGATQITDPQTLASMGFSADAIVYLAPGVKLGETSPVVEGPNTYGTSSVIQMENAGNSFRGRVSTYAYGTSTGGGDVSFTGGDIFTDAHLQLPSGALWESTRYWVNDADAAQDIGMFLFKSCLPVAGPGAPVNTVLGSGNSTGSSGDQSIVVSAANTAIDNNGCIYWVRARFDAVGLVLRKARTQYRLQVSPAPATATFADVPTSSGQFRFVEALVAAGITSGCGGSPPNYCPNDPVTRGQMAVFLAVALGLHFPN